MTVVVIDDERTFRDDRAEHIRTTSEALAVMARWHTRYYMGYGDMWDSLWLDHDLGEDDDIRIVVQYMVTMATFGCPFPVRTVYVHTQNAVGGQYIVDSMEASGYKVYRTDLPLLVN